jgi:hypothetical protein
LLEEIALSKPEKKTLYAWVGAFVVDIFRPLFYSGLSLVLCIVLGINRPRDQEIVMDLIDFINRSSVPIPWEEGDNIP